MRYVLALIVFFVGAGAFSFADADLYTQGQPALDISSSSPTVLFKIGTGNDGILQRVQFYGNRVGTTGTLEIEIRCFTESSYTTRCPNTEMGGTGHAVSGSVALADSPSLHYVNYVTGTSTTYRTFVSNRYYDVQYMSSNGAGAGVGDIDVYGISVPNICYPSAIGHCTGSPFIVFEAVINWNESIGQYTVSSSTAGLATSTGLFSSFSASSTLAAISNCAGSGNFFGEAICIAFSYLFLPNPQVLDQWVNLPNVAQEKFPFSWVSDVKNSITGLSASSTANSPTYAYNLADLGLGSTTPLGNMLPNFTAFSSSTALTYMPAGVWAAGQALMAAVLWLALGFDIYATVRRRHAHV